MKDRIESIDLLRGLAMAIMALDHVRDYFHLTANTDDPLNLNTTTMALFFTRWITHFCAPVFVFLSGTSIYLQSLRKTKKELSLFLIKRGLWLIFLEVVVVSFGWSFNPAYHGIFLQVIWAIGISMVVLGLLINLPFNAILAIGALIVLGHNGLDYLESAEGFQVGFFWNLFHHGFFTPYFLDGDHYVLIIYAFVPWTGLMMLGYCFGKYFSSFPQPSIRRKKIFGLGILLIGLFVLLRGINQYGDPHAWAYQSDGIKSFLSFINVNKYPPSLMFMSLMIGLGMMVLAWVESVKNIFTDFLRTFGRVSLFYYLVHIYLIHQLSTISFFMRGHTFAEGYHKESHFPFYFLVQGEGYGLPVVYGVWILVLILLYPLCKWYDRYKTAHKEKWWLSYL